METIHIEVRDVKTNEVIASWEFTTQEWLELTEKNKEKVLEVILLGKNKPWKQST